MTKKPTTTPDASKANAAQTAKKKGGNTSKAKPVPAQKVKPTDAPLGDVNDGAQSLDSTAEAGAAPSSRSMGKKLLARAAALATTEAPHLAKAPVPAFDGREFERLPNISAVSGAALQADIAELNKAVIRVLKTAARMGASEPLAPMLLGTSQDMIDLFFNPVTGDRLLSQSLGFPLVQLRIHDVGVMRQMISDGVVSATSVQALTKTFPLEIVQTATRQRRGV